MSINQEFRTRYDQEMQALFAPNCSSKRKLPHNLGHVSYACSPGLGCHLLHQAPGRDASGTRYSNMDDCNKSCTHPHVAPHSIPTHLIPGSHHPAHPAHLIPGSHHPAHPAHLIPGSSSSPCSFDSRIPSSSSFESTSSKKLNIFFILLFKYKK